MKDNNFDDLVSNFKNSLEGLMAQLPKEIENMTEKMTPEDNEKMNKALNEMKLGDRFKEYKKNIDSLKETMGNI